MSELFLKRLYKFPCQKPGCSAKADVELVRPIENQEEENIGYYCESCGRKALKKQRQLNKLSKFDIARR